MFSVVQLKPAPPLANDPFHCPRLHMLPAVFVDSNTDAVKSFKVDRLLNKQTVKKSKGHAVEYFVCWTGYRPE